MARLDPLLQAMVDRKAEELVLVQGARPAFRFGVELQPVSKQELNLSQITGLLAELSDRIQPGAAVPPAGRFRYAFPDGLAFDCQIDRGESGLTAVVRPRVEIDPQGSTVTAPPPRPAPIPVPRAIAAARPGEPEIDVWLRHMVELGASDLHLSADEAPMLRVDGEMKRMPGAEKVAPEKTRELIESILPERTREQYERSHDSDFAYEIEGLARFRVNVFTDRKGTGTVFRTIPSRVATAEELDLPASVLDLCRLTKGLVLVTGPTGSGKSTTLAAMIDHINRTRCEHIVTIEDPIEFVHSNQQCLVNQREVHTHTEGFRTALRAALREDPDVVLVGELRDLETIAIAIETAETGHLVFGTLHTTSACSTVDRVIDQFPSDRQAQIRAMLSESLKGVISQMLLKRSGGGRVAALEILVVTPAISNLIREEKSFQIPSLMQTGKKHGMQLMNDAMVQLVRRKLVDPDEAYRKAVDKAGIAAALRAIGVRPVSVVEP